MGYCQPKVALPVSKDMATAVRKGALVDDDNEHALVAAAAAGDREAAEALLVRHQATVARVCRHLVPREDDFEAAVQETLLRALQGLGSYSGEGSFASWIAAIAVNLCRDRWRRRRLVPFLPLEHADDETQDPLARTHAEEPDPERVAMARQAARLVRREVARLPQRQREVFTLRFFAELDLDEISAVLGVDVGTVKTHLYRAVHRVRAAVEEAMP